jgi:hypothetical protein
VGQPDGGQPPPPPPPTDAGHPDAGTPPDAGHPDAGPPDSGVPDAGTDGGVITFDTPGPWPMTNEVYGASDGILESPVVGVTTDEPVSLPGPGAKVTQNMWVATNSALYLMRPGDTKFRRYDARDGLHLPGNPETSCDDVNGNPISPCPNAAADVPGISEIEGGAPDEVFVGYYGHHDWNSGNLPDGTPIDGSSSDDWRHSGQLDRVHLRADGSIEVVRFTMVSGDSTAFWHNRTIERMVYDHFIHKHELYVGTDHGVDKFSPDLWTALPPRHSYDDWVNGNRIWMSDHLHAQTCFHHPCGDGETDLRLGDWRALALASNGDLWTGGRWAAGEIIYTPDNAVWFNRGGKSFSQAFGDPYTFCDGGRPVFCVPQEGDFVNLSAVAVTSYPLDPTQDQVWFSSGVIYGDPGDVNYGVARFLVHPKGLDQQWTYYDPVRDIGMAEVNVRDMLALPDGRLVLAGPNSGLTFWDPATGMHSTLRAGQGIPSDQVYRMELDTMVNPPALHVATAGGAAVLRHF